MFKEWLKYPQPHPSSPQNGFHSFTYVDKFTLLSLVLTFSFNHCSAEALDNHLTAIQRDHEHISQLEERKIRDDAAVEEAKRKEKALQEEKLRQQKDKEEQEVCKLNIVIFTKG